MTDTKPTIEEQIETLQRIIGRTTGIQAFVNPDILTDILASLKELAAIKSQPVPQWVSEELADGDRICKALGLERTEGGRLPMNKILANLRPHTLTKDCWCNPQVEDYTKQQPVPVEPEQIKMMRYDEPEGRSDYERAITDYIDSLQSALKVAQQERDAEKEIVLKAVKQICTPMSENIKGWKERAEKAEASNKRLVVAENAELRKDAEVGSAIEMAAKDLPENFELEITVERGAASVYLRTPDAETVCIDVDSDNRLAAEIRNAIDQARSANDKG
jgi:hypothetical protein